MPFSGTGVFNLSFDWNNDAANGIPITASRVQAEDQNIADGLSMCVTADGQSTTSASVPFSQGASFGVVSQFNAAGRLGIGMSPATQVLSINATSSAGPSNNAAGIQINDAAANPAYLVNRNGSMLLDVGTGNIISFLQNNVQTAEIDANGCFLVNTSTVFGTVAAVATTAGGNTNGMYCSQPNNNSLWAAIQTDIGGTNVLFMRCSVSGVDKGSVGWNGTNVTFNTTSDYRLKDVTGDLTTSGAFIDALSPKVGNWKDGNKPFVGFIADEVQAVSPSSVSGEKDAVGDNGNPVYQQVAYSSPEIIANIIAELKSLRARVAVLESAQ